MCFSGARWIWVSENAGKDEYGEFVAPFVAKRAPATLRISCDGDYTALINGKYVSSNQYGDFEHYKIYDEIDIGDYLNDGKNEIFILVWHTGENFSRSIAYPAGVIFEIEQGSVILESGTHIPCRISAAYKNGYCKSISSQLCFSFLYDSTCEGQGELKRAVEVKKHCTLYPRPTKRLELLAPKSSHVLIDQGNYYLVDLGEETVGLISFDFVSKCEQKILIAWGEDLQDGHVRRKIGNRDFSLEYIAKRGENRYTNYMLRLGCRYMELYSDEPIDLNYLTLIPQIYQVREREISVENEADRRIADICTRTLSLCMMEHYVDTPWREQSLYAFDSRNQMLSGYRVFEGGNGEYARANLLLMSKDKRDDGLLSICYPCGKDLTIPSFSLYYFIAVKEYVENTGDLSLAQEVYSKLCSVLDAFLDNVKGGLVSRFEGKSHWNFYDWTQYLDGRGDYTTAEPDLVINCLFILALESFREISQKLGKPFAYNALIDTVRANTRSAFYSADEHAFTHSRGGAEYTVLGNSLAILAGVAEKPDDLCEKITSGDLMDCTLSMRCFKYDALILTNKEKWHPWVLNEIRTDYKKMLDAGATSVWETIEGAPAFSNAGSLCHGWSAVPVLYLTR